MPRKLFTAADIRLIKADYLLLDSEDIITPEALDTARELGVRLIRQNPSLMPISVSFPEPSNQARPSIPISLPPLKIILGDGVVMDPFGDNLSTPGTNVRLKDVVTSNDRSSMAAGYMALDKGVFPWTLTYDEIDIVLEGTLVITRAETSVKANSGDVIFIPKGSSITFSTTSHVRFVYVAFPANWMDQ